jgi:hypothetical protein
MFEVYLGVDIVEFDDSWFQIGLTEIEKQFVNVKQAALRTTNRSIYVDKSLQNYPAMVIYMGI